MNPKLIATGNSAQVGTIDLFDLDSDDSYIMLTTNSIDLLLLDELAVILNDTYYPVIFDSSAISFSSKCQFNETKQSYCQTLNLTKPGPDYAGDVSVTQSGRKCQRWDVQIPEAHTWPAYSNNYCRNEDGGTNGAWCYLADGHINGLINGSERWDYCSQIPGNVKTYSKRKN